MRPKPTHTAIAAIAALLALAALVGRLGLPALLTRDRPPDLSAAGPLCAGFAGADGEIVGVADGETAAELVAAAVEQLGLPAACRDLELPPEIERGALIRLRLARGSCELAAIDRLPGPQRMVCGSGVDVNRNPVRDIELLPGIGPKKAGAIVESRERHGPFETLDDLKRVKGIGVKTVERIRPWAEPPR
jgi:competence ComEA-like helix-hairpin-helix protein